jgi:hypothetical protein
MVEASRRSGFGDSAEDGMVRALAVVRAAMKSAQTPRRRRGPASTDDYQAGYEDAFCDVLYVLDGGEQR